MHMLITIEYAKLKFKIAKPLLHFVANVIVWKTHGVHDDMFKNYLT